MSHRHQTLIVAPYVGEFGWELMNWQGRVRRLIQRGGYARTIVLAGCDRAILYEDPHADGRLEIRTFPTESIAGESNDDHRLDDSGTPFGPAELRCTVRAAAERMYPDLRDPGDHADWFFPDYRSGLWPTTASWQTFRSLRRDTASRIDILLVPRRRTLAPERNLSPGWWAALALALRGRGLSVEWYADGMGAALGQLSAARLAVGASTGGLHLASLCGCPHYVWGAGDDHRWTRWRISNQQRYEAVWNPLGTPCIYDGIGWQPSVDHVVTGAVRALARIGLGTGRAQRMRHRVTWRLRRIMDCHVRIRPTPALSQTTRQKPRQHGFHSVPVTRLAGSTG